MMGSTRPTWIVPQRMRQKALTLPKFKLSKIASNACWKFAIVVT